MPWGQGKWRPRSPQRHVVDDAGGPRLSLLAAARNRDIAGDTQHSGVGHKSAKVPSKTCVLKFGGHYGIVTPNTGRKAAEKKLTESCIPRS